MPIDDGHKLFKTRHVVPGGPGAKEGAEGPDIEAMDWGHAAQIAGEMGGLEVTGEAPREELE